MRFSPIFSPTRKHLTFFHSTLKRFKSQISGGDFKCTSGDFKIRGERIIHGLNLRGIAGHLRGVKYQIGGIYHRRNLTGLKFDSERSGEIKFRKGEYSFLKIHLQEEGGKVITLSMESAYGKR